MAHKFTKEEIEWIKAQPEECWEPVGCSIAEDYQKWLNGEYSYGPIVQEHAPSPENAETPRDTRPSRPEPADSKRGEGCVSRLVRSLLFDRSHTEERPTRFEGATEHKDGTHTCRFVVSCDVSKEEYETLLENKIWAKNIFIQKDGSLEAQIDPSCL